MTKNEYDTIKFNLKNLFIAHISLNINLHRK